MAAALDEFQRALTRDDSFRPRLRRGRRRTHPAGLEPPAESTRGLRRAQAGRQQGSRVHRNLPEADSALAFARLVLDWDWAGAEAGFKKALELAPGAARAHEEYAWYLAARGQTEAALGEMKRAKELDPLSPMIAAGIGGILMYAHRTDEAIEQNRRALELNPGFMVAKYGLGRFYLQKGDARQAIANLREALSLAPSSPSILADLAHAYAAAGDARESLRTLERAGSSSPAADSSVRSRQPMFTAPWATRLRRSRCWSAPTATSRPAWSGSRWIRALTPCGPTSASRNCSNGSGWGEASAALDLGSRRSRLRSSKGGVMAKGERIDLHGISQEIRAVQKKLKGAQRRYPGGAEPHRRDDPAAGGSPQPHHGHLPQGLRRVASRRYQAHRCRWGQEEARHQGSIEEVGRSRTGSVRAMRVTR